MTRMSKLATLELQRKGALDLADALFNENERLKKQITEANKTLAQCCKECSEDTFRLNEVCQNDCKINSLKTSLGVKSSK